MYDPRNSDTYRAIQEEGGSYSNYGTSSPQEVTIPVQTKVYQPNRLVPGKVRSNQGRQKSIQIKSNQIDLSQKTLCEGIHDKIARPSSSSSVQSLPISLSIYLSVPVSLLLSLSICVKKKMLILTPSCTVEPTEC